MKTLEKQLATLTSTGELLRVEIRRPDGTVVAASEPGGTGRTAAADPAFAAATQGNAQAAIVPVAEAATAAGAAALPADTVIREELPIETGGRVRGIVVMWRDAAPVLARLADVRRDVVLVTLSAGLIAAALLFFIFRAAQTRLTRQTAELVESTRRDPLTGSLNHGALVAHLAETIERARTAGAPLGVALVDVDNFRLLNDIHGHGAGDEALLAVDGLIAGRAARRRRRRPVRPGRVPAHRPGRRRGVARADPRPAPDLARRPRPPVRGHGAPADHDQRRDRHLSGARRFRDVAPCRRGPDAPGGEGEWRRRGPRRGPGRPAPATVASFDVLQGLVHAVDTKDRYTKRHSEDVARYGVFLAQRVAAPSELVATIRTAGLLHDVGKIGIPDAILRKPGKLTDAEYAVVKQHVALGDAIVRDLPDVELIRAGIRHHHEAVPHVRLGRPVPVRGGRGAGLAPLGVRGAAGRPAGPARPAVRGPGRARFRRVRAEGHVLRDHGRAAAGLGRRDGVLPRAAGAVRRRRDPAPGVLRRPRRGAAAGPVGVLQASRGARRGAAPLAAGRLRS